MVKVFQQENHNALTLKEMDKLCILFIIEQDNFIENCYKMFLYKKLRENKF